ncbi:pterin-4-alpha-carbinolamine dehydratase [Aspergillus sp. HF37]|nr:pterin-4-alpha-carbinolamine dehydratase [Aspergillus sp. HF37]
MIRTATLPLLTRLSTPRLSRMSSSVSGMQPQYSAGEDEATVQRGVEALTGAGWGLDSERMGVQKTYYFRSYFKAISFVNMIAAESAVKKHHAVMTVRFGSVDVHWTTHNPRGLSQKDVDMAQHCERGADVMGSVGAGQGLKCS